MKNWLQNWLDVFINITLGGVDVEHISKKNCLLPFSTTPIGLKILF